MTFSAMLKSFEQSEMTSCQAFEDFSAKLKKPRVKRTDSKPQNPGREKETSDLDYVDDKNKGA
ncbi:MAG: hypothetical protein KKE71_05480 [Nanoarchaeota archaeon]|nr:hypothetical protein [Nanoarchaeota archaeon]MBU4451512.1 hypothetical protein [Nanoarchaeota archaeon]